MSSRREVLIKIALSQRKTLIETKNRTLKCLKWHYSTVRSMKNVAVLTEGGAFALFFRPHPREFAIQGKKMLMPGGQPGKGSWNWLMHKWIHQGTVSNLLLLLTETKRRWLTKLIRSSWWLDSSGGTQWTLREMSPDGNRTKTCCIGQKDVKTALNWTRK